LILSYYSRPPSGAPFLGIFCGTKEKPPKF
jgi:hypothetical protein